MDIVKNRITSHFPYYPKIQSHNSTPNNQIFNYEPWNRRRKRGEREVSIRKTKNIRRMRTFIPHCGESFSPTTEFNLLYGRFKTEIHKVQIVLTQRVGDNGCLRGKPKRGKNHGSPQTPNCPLCDESYNDGVGGNDLALYLFANGRLQQNDIL